MFQILSNKKLTQYIVNDCKKRGIFKETLISSISNEVIEETKKELTDSKTGKVSYVSLSTFIPSKSMITQLTNEVQETKADYLIIHAGNMKNLDKIKEILPSGKKLMIWYLTNDQTYIIKNEVQTNQKGLFNVKPKLINIKNLIKNPEPCGWWC